MKGCWQRAATPRQWAAVLFCAVLGLLCVLTPLNALGAQVLALSADGRCHVRPDHGIANGESHEPWQPCALGNSLYVLDDPRGTLEAHDVTSAEFQSHFVPFHDHKRGFEFTPSVYWLRFTVKHEAVKREESNTWVIELFRAIDEARLCTTASRDLSDCARQDSAVSSILSFRIMPKETEDTYWIRVKGRNALVAEPVIWFEPAFRMAVNKRPYLYASYYGAILFIILINLLFMLSTNDRAYRYYIIVHVGMAMQHAAIDRYLWPPDSPWAMRSEFFFAGMTYLGGIGLCRRFLDIPSLLPDKNRFLSVFMGAAGLLMVLSLLPFPPDMQQLPLAIMSWACLLAVFYVSVWYGIRTWVKGNPNAPIHLGAFLVLIFGTVAGVVATEGWAPSGLPLTASEMGVAAPKIASVAAALVYTLGLALRVYRLQRDKERVQADLAQTLDQRVQERTRELETAQARMIQQARLASVGKFVSGVTHEIGNPLNFALGGARELSRRLGMIDDALSNLPGQLREHAELARASKALVAAGRAARLVEHGFDRIRKIVDAVRGLGSKHAQVAPVDLIAELEMTLSLLSGQLEERSIRVTRDFAPIPSILGRSGEMGQVFMNLILNACQAMPSGGELRIACQSDEQMVSITFQDTGPGVALEHRETIFDPFFTTRPPGEGTGLGLSVSHDLVERHRGQLELDESEIGARFVITLPLAPPESSARSATETTGISEEHPT